MQTHSNYSPSLWENGRVTICNIVIKASVTSLLIFFKSNCGVQDLHNFHFSHILRKAELDIMSFESQLECRFSNIEAGREINGI